jgi:hypothetical protein
MLQTGAILLSIWSGLNLLVAAVVTGVSLASRPPALAMLLGDEQIARVDPKLMAVVRAQAALCNPCIVALCVLVLAMVWRAVIRRVGWAWWTLAAALAPLQAFGFVSDALLGNRNLAANLISTALLAAGLALSSPYFWKTARS